MLDGIGKRERKYVGKMDKVLLIKVNLPPLDKFSFTQQAVSPFSIEWDPKPCEI
jgi:hypothetical protein